MVLMKIKSEISRFRVEQRNSDRNISEMLDFEKKSTWLLELLREICDNKFLLSTKENKRHCLCSSNVLATRYFRQPLF